VVVHLPPGTGWVVAHSNPCVEVPVHRVSDAKTHSAAKNWVACVDALFPVSAPLQAAATPSDAYGVGFGAEELEPQTPRALLLASQALSQARRMRHRRPTSACSATMLWACSTRPPTQVTKTIPIPTGPHGLVITPDNKWVYASSDGDSVVSVISTATDEVATSIDVGTTPHGLAITPDGSRVLVAGYGNQ
jgi:YVTN family beta-propeller protein